MGRYSPSITQRTYITILIHQTSSVFPNIDIQKTYKKINRYVGEITMGYFINPDVIY